MERQSRSVTPKDRSQDSRSSRSQERVKFNEKVEVISPPTPPQRHEEPPQEKAADQSKWKPKSRRGGGWSSWKERRKGKRHYRDFERKPVDREGAKEPYASSQESFSESEAELGPKAEEVLDGYRNWLKSNDFGGLSTAQAGAHLLLQVKQSGSKLGAYMNRMLDEPTQAGGSDRQRGVLPLPIWKDARKEVQRILSSGEYKRLAGTWKDKQQMKGGKVEREMRRVGLLVWHFLLCCGLNFLWTGGRSVGAVCARDPTKAQKRCLDHLWESAKSFVDDRSEVKEKLVRSPSTDEWSSKLEGVRISYHGESVEKAREITLAQIMPGLPPEGYGGRIQLADLCEGEVKELLLHPEKCMVEGEELPAVFESWPVMKSGTSSVELSIGEA